MSNESTDLQKRAPASSALVEIEQARVIQEVQGAIVMARKFPRDEQEAVKRILKACERPALAEAAIYAYPRGDTVVTGPSIRLAEAIAQNWGNLQFGVRELSRTHGESTAQAVAWDLETNTRAEKIFQVPHVRDTKKGSYRITDSRDIYEIVANQGARRVRACILSVVPGDVVEAAMGQCEKTQAEGAKGIPLPDRIKKMVEGFAAVQVTQQMIEAKLKHAIDKTTLAEVKSMGRVLLTIQDGMAGVEDFFLKPGEKKADVRQSVAEKAGEAKAGGIAGLFGGRRQPKANPDTGEQEEQPEKGKEELDIF